MSDQRLSGLEGLQHRESLAVVHEPPPKSNSRPACWDRVIQDMHDRDSVGFARYGTRLQPFNGRDALVDLYQELLDAVVYTRQEMSEREAARSAVRRLLGAVQEHCEACETLDGPCNGGACRFYDFKDGTLDLGETWTCKA